jgi:uncharacterized protein YhbP (UPF0306 family)
MTIIPASISDFIKASKAASFCCIDTLGHPYCFNAYYAFLEAEGWLVVPAIGAEATSTASTPASMAAIRVASCPPAVS